MMTPAILAILMISVPISLSITSTPPSGPTDENPSSDLPTIQNNKQSKPLQDGDLNSTPSCSLPASTNLDVQASCLSPASPSPPPPGDQRETTAFFSHVSKTTPTTATSSTRRETCTFEEGDHSHNSVPSCSSPQGGRNMRREGKEPMWSPSSTSSPVRTSLLKPYTKITTPGSSSYQTQHHQSPHSPRIRHQTRPSLLPLTTFFDPEGGRDPINPHRIDDLSKCILNYILMSGLSTTGAWAQRPALSTSIYIQCGLNQFAISILLLARFAVYDTNPEMAVIMVRLSFALAVISGYLSTMPMLAPYFAIIMLIVVAVVCFFARVFRDKPL